MSGTRWQWRDAGSASGQFQRVADSGTYNRVQRAYRVYIDHSVNCGGCGHGEVRCATADELWAAYMDART